MPRGMVYVAPCNRTDDAVQHQPVRLLEILDDLLRPRSENSVDAVGSQDLHTGEDPLKSLHVVPGVAQLDGHRHVDSPILPSFFCLRTHHTKVTRSRSDQRAQGRPFLTASSSFPRCCGHPRIISRSFDPTRAAHSREGLEVRIRLPPAASLMRTGLSGAPCRLRQCG